MYCHFAKWRHTIILLRHSETRSYAVYGFWIYRRHIRRLSIALRAGVPAAIFTKYGCRQLVIVQHCLRTMLAECYIAAVV